MIGRPYPKGVTGNARGRPPAVETIIRQTIGPHVEALARQCVVAGLSGSPECAAASLVLYASVTKARKKSQGV